MMVDDDVDDDNGVVSGMQKSFTGSFVEYN
jgi:hypothetical protein